MEQSKEKVIWEAFQSKLGLSEKQVELFKQYAALLMEWNERINLSAITSLKGIVTRHFLDSLMVGKWLKLEGLIVDVGSGAGMPGIPLKIAFPELKVILLEVNHKKQNFLREVIKILELEDIEVCDLDFRTFLRTTEAPVNLFCARASLDLVELSRIFKPGCSYKSTKLVYWASKDFEVDPKVEGLVLDEFEYKNDKKQRRLLRLGLTKLRGILHPESIDLGGDG